MTLSFQDLVADSLASLLVPSVEARIVLRQPISVLKNRLRDDQVEALSSQEPVIPQKDLDVLVRLPAINKSKWQVTVLQKWLGYVERLQGEHFVAIVHDLTSPQNPTEEIEFDRTELSKSDLPLLTEGAAFYWSIGYQDTEGGQRERVSMLRFARHPRLGDAETKHAFQLAEELVSSLECE
jgi:hypothetical protein